MKFIYLLPYFKFYNIKKRRMLNVLCLYVILVFREFCRKVDLFIFVLQILTVHTYYINNIYANIKRILKYLSFYLNSVFSCKR